MMMNRPFQKQILTSVCRTKSKTEKKDLYRRKQCFPEEVEARFPSQIGQESVKHDRVVPAPQPESNQYQTAILFSATCGQDLAITPDLDQVQFLD
ncbi:hypothetical protein RRG08_054004 [Elysia crispata]|uniref:Uncharacterized protein n=1 Tax=Elysia crispata TaxID=231223 RepID=A0AAE1DDK8_9GAST|nr:hypothetical protein RRG08_054004 [Elysia crispata]